MTITTNDKAGEAPKLVTKDYGKDVVRYVVPLIVGYAVAIATKLGLKLDPTVAYSVVAPVVSSAWYALVALIEKRIPVVGRLLGAQKPKA